MFWVGGLIHTAVVFWRFGFFIDEAIGIDLKGLVKDGLASGVDLVGLYVMRLVWRHQADAQMMIAIVLVKK
jgi:hypothetical protein